MFPSKFLQFPSILTHFHAANEKIQNGGRDLAISRGLVWVKNYQKMYIQWKTVGPVNNTSNSGDENENSHLATKAGCKNWVELKKIT